MSETSSIQSKYQTIIGSVYLTIAWALISANDTIVKLSELSISQIVLTRFIVQCLIAVLIWNITQRNDSDSWYGPWYGHKLYVKNVWARGLCVSIEIICYYYAVKLLPIGDVNAIYSQNALMIAILAKIFCKEQLPRLYPILLIFGLVGTIFVTQPTFLINCIQKYVYHNNNIANIKPLNITGLVAIIGGMVSWSLACILIKSAKQSHYLQLEISSSIQTIFLTVPALIVINQYVMEDAIIDNNFSLWQFDFLSCITMITIGSFGFGALSLVTLGYQMGDTAKISWTEYMLVVFNTLSQVLVFDDALNLFEWIGVVLISIAYILCIGEQYYEYHQSKKIQYHQVSVDSSNGDRELIILSI